MNISAYLKRILSPNKVVVGGAVTLRTVLCGLFIAVIALFRTSPVNERRLPDKPLPLPAELDLDEFAPGAGLRWRGDAFSGTAADDFSARAQVQAEVQ